MGASSSLLDTMGGLVMGEFVIGWFVDDLNCFLGLELTVVSSESCLSLLAASEVSGVFDGVGGTCFNWGRWK
jgi:hypothetical protein